MRRIGYAIWVICLSSAVVSVASAQSDWRSSDFSHGTTLNGFAGVAVDSSNSGPVLGGAIGWDLTPRLGIEGSGSWAEFGHGTSAFGGAMKLRVRVVRTGAVNPYVHAGVGMYRAMFGYGETVMPSFYARRMATRIGLPGGGSTFTDPTVLGGAGVDIAINRYIALRPDVQATVVFGQGRQHVVTSVGLQAVYHFEHRPVTPAVGR